jgi:hypothetical protein
VAWAYSRLKKDPNQGTSWCMMTAHLPDSVRNYIKVGNIGELKADMRNLVKITPQSKQGLFYLHKAIEMVTDTNTRLVDVKGSINRGKNCYPGKCCQKKFYL